MSISHTKIITYFVQEPKELNFSIQFNNVYLSALKSHGSDKLYIYHKKTA